MEAMELKKAYQEKADAQLREWQVWIEHFKVNPVNQDHQNCIDRLEKYEQIARTQLQDLRGCSDGRWELVKHALERAMIELKRVMDEVGVEYTGKRVQLQQDRSHVYIPFSRKG